MENENLMKQYLGTKVVMARPCNIKDAEDILNRKLDSESEDGYLVEYQEGYKSWSPKDIFEKHYVNTDKGISLSIAIQSAYAGRLIARLSWLSEDKESDDNKIFINKVLFIRPADRVSATIAASFKSLPPSLKKILASKEEESIVFTPYLCTYESGLITNGYVLTTADIMSEDWVVLPD